MSKEREAMMRRQIIVWGTEPEYDVYRKWLEPELLKGSIEIVGLVLDGYGLFQTVDGIKVIKAEDLRTIKHDYLITLHQNHQVVEMVKKVLGLLQIPLDKVIPVKVFGLPEFDLERYLAIRESRISIIANNCWGGFTYHALGMKFLSPFINMFLLSEDYLKLLNRFRYYLNQPLHYIGEEFETVLKRNYPVAGLGDVKLHCNHYTDFASAAAAWEKRKARINFDNLFVEMIIDTKEELDAFLQLPFQQKIGFSTVESSDERIIYFPVMGNGYIKKKYGGNAWNFFNHMAMERSDELRQYDILKLLNKEKDFMRVDYRSN